MLFENIATFLYIQACDHNYRVNHLEVETRNTDNVGLYMINFQVTRSRLFENSR